MAKKAKGPKRVYLPGLTGFGTFVYPKIVKPDLKGKFADSKYKTDFVFDDKASAEAFYKELQAKAKEILPDVDEPMLPVKKTKLGKLVRDDDGSIVFKFKSAKKPAIVDAKRKKLPEGVDVKAGSRGRVSYTLTNYDEGLSMWIDAAQITELVAGSPGANAFDETEGFDAANYEGFEDFDGDEKDEDAEGDEESAKGGDKDFDL